MSITVTVVDNETGDSETMQVADGDYLLTTVAPCFLYYTAAYKNGTHVLTVKGRTAR